MNQLSIRWRLTLWYGAVLAAVLAVFSVSVYLLMSRLLESKTDEYLNHQMVVMEDAIDRAGDETALREKLAEQFAMHPVYEMQVTENGDNTWLRSQRIDRIGLPGSTAPGDLEGGVLEDIWLPNQDQVQDQGHLRMLSSRRTNWSSRTIKGAT